MFGSWFQNSGEKLRKIVTAFFVIEVCLTLVVGLFLIGFAFLGGVISFLISLIAVPLAAALMIGSLYLGYLPTYALAETTCKSTETLMAVREMMKTEEEKLANAPKVKLDPRQMPTWKQVEMLKMGQMVKAQINEEGQYICPVCNNVQAADTVECEKCGMLFFVKNENTEA